MLARIAHSHSIRTAVLLSVVKAQLTCARLMATATDLQRVLKDRLTAQDVEVVDTSGG